MTYDYLMNSHTALEYDGLCSQTCPAGHEAVCRSKYTALQMFTLLDIQCPLALGGKMNGGGGMTGYNAWNWLENENDASGYGDPLNL